MISIYFSMPPFSSPTVMNSSALWLRSDFPGPIFMAGKLIFPQSDVVGETTLATPETSAHSASRQPCGVAELLFFRFLALSSLLTARLSNSTISALSLILAGVISQFASSKPDGLEWSLLNMSDSFVAQTQGYIYSISELIQSKAAILTQIPSVLANIGGLVLLAVLMFALCKLLTAKKVPAYEK